MGGNVQNDNLSFLVKCVNNPLDTISNCKFIIHFGAPNFALEVLPECHQVNLNCYSRIEFAVRFPVGPTQDFGNNGLSLKFLAIYFFPRIPLAETNAQEGTRNTTLNRAAYSLARFVVGDKVAGYDLAHELAGAASRAGLCEDEIRRTIYSAFRARGVVA